MTQMMNMMAVPPMIRRYYGSSSDSSGDDDDDSVSTADDSAAGYSDDDDYGSFPGLTHGVPLTTDTCSRLLCRSIKTGLSSPDTCSCLLCRSIKNDLSSPLFPRRDIPLQSSLGSACFMASTVKENKEGFTKRQFDSANKVARAFYHIAGCPTLTNFKHIIRQNIFKNCPVTVADVDVAERIFGPDLGTLKGKSTRRAPLPVVDDNVAIPPEILEEHKDLVLCIWI